MKLIRACDKQFESASHEDSKNPGVLKKVMLTYQDFIKGFVPMVNWAKLPVGKSFVPHYHETMQEIFIMTKGKAKMIVDKKSFILKPKDVMVVDKHEVHEMINIGKTDVFYVVFGVSEGIEGKTVIVTQ
ncbi:cupin domain-containing protein [Candidatus Beckwithbacteria bacterium]|nr:cupin domain-containing protein [Candidatus Beckwithbacteria bacterium]